MASTAPEKSGTSSTDVLFRANSADTALSSDQSLPEPPVSSIEAGVAASPSSSPPRAVSEVAPAKAPAIPSSFSFTFNPPLGSQASPPHQRTKQIHVDSTSCSCDACRLRDAPDRLPDSVVRSPPALFSFSTTPASPASTFVFAPKPMVGDRPIAGPASLQQATAPAVSTFAFSRAGDDEQPHGTDFHIFCDKRLQEEKARREDAEKLLRAKDATADYLREALRVAQDKAAKGEAAQDELRNEREQAEAALALLRSLHASLEHNFVSATRRHAEASALLHGELAEARATLAKERLENAVLRAELDALRGKGAQKDTAGERRKREADRRAEREAEERLSGRWNSREKQRAGASTSAPPPPPPPPPRRATPLERYKHHWDLLLAATGSEAWRFTLATFPWPAPAPDKITRDSVAAFLGLTRADAAEQKQIVRQQLLRWHPDKFGPRGTLRLIVETDRAAAERAQGEVVVCLHYWLERATAELARR